MKTEKYKITIDGKESELEMTQEGKALFKGNEVSFDHHFLKNNIISLRINGRNCQVILSDREVDSDINQFSLEINSKIHEVVCKNEIDRLIDKFSSGTKNSHLKSSIRSPMPGIVLKLFVKEGDTVKKGDVLLLLEAMKMENELKSTMDGIIKKISVGEKASVEKNQMLIELE
ncbi:acetyl-CoA carboxylase biotin carboxyl carrier protein subunit [soil metagenome]